MTILATTTVEAAAVKARDQGDLIDSSAAFIATDGSSQSERRGRSALNKAASKTSSMGSSSEAKSTSAAPSPGVSEFAVSRKDRRKKDKGKAPILEGHGSKGKKRNANANGYSSSSDGYDSDACSECGGKRFHVISRCSKKGRRHQTLL